MQIVIDIPEHIYEHAKEQSEDSNDEWDAMRAIANGTLLPEHKGRLMLIDIDELPFFRCPNNINKCPSYYDFTCQHCDYGITSRFRVERMGILIESNEEIK